MASTDIEMYRGDDKTLTLTFKDSTGTTINITGYSIFFTVKDKLSYTDDSSDSDSIISSLVTSHTHATSGISELTILNSQTSTVTPGKYIYDIQLKDSSSKILTVVAGAFIMNADVTRRTV
jgi:hypothetical protein